MAIRINQKIVEYGIEPRNEAPAAPPPRPKADVIHMHEKIERPETLLWLYVQDQDAAVGSCPVRDDQ